MVNVGITGLGFMGMIHYLAYQRVSGCKVAAICEQIPERLEGDWRSIKGNFGPRGKKMDLSGIAKYQDFEELLANPDIDVVDICLPPAAHPEMTIRALKAGKHVFCEKPIAIDAADAKKMVATAQSTGKMLLIGHVLPFFAAYRYAYRTVASGKYGKMIGGHFKRIISDPTWMRYFWNPDHGGGPMIDLNIHDFHFVRLLCGMPTAVQTVGTMRNGLVELFNSQFMFNEPKVVTVQGRRNQPAGPPLHQRLRNLSRKGNAGIRFVVGTPGHPLDQRRSHKETEVVRRRSGRRFRRGDERGRPFCPNPNPLPPPRR